MIAAPIIGITIGLSGAVEWLIFGNSHLWVIWKVEVWPVLWRGALFMDIGGYLEGVETQEGV